MWRTFVGASHPFHLLTITNFPSYKVREHSCLANKYGGIIYMSYVTIKNLWLKKKILQILIWSQNLSKNLHAFQANCTFEKYPQMFREHHRLLS